MKKIIHRFRSEAAFRRVAVIFMIAFVIRFVYICTLDETWPFLDTVHYHTAALNLIKGGGFGPSLYFPNLFKYYCLEPVYPLFLALCYVMLGPHLWAARFFQVLLSIIQLFIIFSLAENITSRKTTLGVLLYASFFPFLIYLTGFLYPTLLFSFLVTLNLFLFYKYFMSRKIRWLALGGMTLGLAMSTIALYLLSVPLFLLWLFFATSLSLTQKLKHSVILLASIVIVLIPWSVRNYLVFNKVSFGRAFVDQSVIYDNSFWAIQKKRVYKETGFKAEKFGVFCYSENDRLAFDFYIDDKPIFKYISLDRRVARFDDSYIGVMMCGPLQNEIKRVRAMRRSISQGDTTDRVIMDTQVGVPEFIAHENIRQDGPAFRFAGTGHSWEYPVVFNMKSNANYFELYYPAHISPDQADRIGLLIGLNRPDMSADGILAWMHPWGEPDLWWIVNGKPDHSIAVKKLTYGTDQFRLISQLQKYPVLFFTEHYIPNFIKFWSPWIKGIREQEQKPTRFLQWISFISLMPLFVFLPIGIWSLRHKWRELLLILIPIVTLSFGYSLFGTQTRYRLPIDILLIFLAVRGMVWFLQILQDKAVFKIFFPARKK